MNQSPVWAAYNRVARKSYLYVRQTPVAQYGRHIFILFASALCLCMCSCHTSKESINHTPLTINHTDTLYLNRIQYDSVFVNNYHLVDRGGDTIIIQDAKVEYRYRLLRDTIKVHQIDSIPVIKEVEVTKEIERPLTFFDHLCRYCFYLVLITLFVGLVRFVVRNRTTIITFITKII